MQVDYSPIQSNEASPNVVSALPHSNNGSPSAGLLTRRLHLRMLALAATAIALVLAFCSQYFPTKYKAANVPLTVPVEQINPGSSINYHSALNSAGIGMVPPAFHRYFMTTPADHAHSVDVDTVRSAVPNDPVHVRLAPFVPIHSVLSPNMAKPNVVSAATTAEEVYKKRIALFEQARSQAYSALDHILKTASANPAHLSTSPGQMNVERVAAVSSSEKVPIFRASADIQHPKNA